MSDLLGCLVFLWCGAVIVGIVMIEWRLASISRRLESIEREEKRRNGGSR